MIRPWAHKVTLRTSERFVSSSHFLRNLQTLSTVLGGLVKHLLRSLIAHISIVLELSWWDQECSTMFCERWPLNSSYEVRSCFADWRDTHELKFWFVIDFSEELCSVNTTTILIEWKPKTFRFCLLLYYTNPKSSLFTVTITTGAPEPVKIGGIDLC